MAHFSILNLYVASISDGSAFYFFLFTFIIEVLYSAFVFLHIVWWNRSVAEPSPDCNSSTSVSIIIAARNEEKTISRCLASILAQDYPTELMEVIVCDDQSDDHTIIEAKRFLAGGKLRNKVIESASNMTGKKKAIEAAIKVASGELIIQTDADCTAEKTWVSMIAGAYLPEKTTMICAPVALIGERNFCDKFQSLELCGLSLLTGAGIKAGVPLMCNGANMAYSRTAFSEIGGFTGIDDIPSGDDTLLLFKMNNRFPGTIKFIKSRNAIVYTHAQPGWTNFFQQRLRWASKGFRGGNFLNTSAGLLVFLANFSLLVSGLLLFLSHSGAESLICSIILKAVIDFLLLSFASKFFDKRRLLSFFPLSELVTVIYISMAGIIAHRAGYRWKGRKYSHGGTVKKDV